MNRRTQMGFSLNWSMVPTAVAGPKAVGSVSGLAQGHHLPPGHVTLM